MFENLEGRELTEEEKAEVARLVDAAAPLVPFVLMGISAKIFVQEGDELVKRIEKWEREHPDGN
jgi:hypothetical protein